MPAEGTRRQFGTSESVFSQRLGTPNLCFHRVREYSMPSYLHNLLFGILEMISNCGNKPILSALI